MIPLFSLWIPILASAAGVFAASSVIHMLLTYHRNDFVKLPDEDAIMDALRAHNIPPGDYMMPHCTGPNDMKDAAVMDKMNRGPVAIMTVIRNGPPAMGSYLFQWFLFCVVVSFFVAYLLSRTLAPGAEYLEVFRVAGTIGFGAYALGSVPDSIWYNRKWSSTIKNLVDGLVYGLVTGGFFGWLWPAA